MSIVPWFGSFVPIIHACVPVNVKEALPFFSAFDHADALLFSIVQELSSTKSATGISARLLGSLTDVPASSVSKPSVALNTPMLLIIGVEYAERILIRTALPSTGLLLHKRFAETVLPSPNSSHLPLASLYSTENEEIVWPFCMYSSIETTSNLLIPPRLIWMLPVVSPSSGAQ